MFTWSGRGFVSKAEAGGVMGRTLATVPVSVATSLFRPTTGAGSGMCASVGDSLLQSEFI